MTDMIRFGETIAHVCDQAVVDVDGNVTAVINNVPDAVYSAWMDPVVVHDVTLPTPWPGNGYTYADGVFTPMPITDDARAPVNAAIDAYGQAILDGGCLISGLHIALDDTARIDLTAMGATAMAASSGALPWPESYQQGWITTENIRIPLDTPAEALAMTVQVGIFYAGIKQNIRDLKDRVIVATTAEELAAIDITSGWPPH